MLAHAKLDFQIVLYRALLNGRCCQHPNDALQKDGIKRVCRVCGHSFLEVRCG